MGRRRSTGTARLLLLGVVGATILTGCYMASACTPPRELTSDRMAIIAAGSVPDLARGAFPGAMQLDVYSYAEGCPDISYRLSGRGYRGSVPLVRGQLRELALKGDEPVLLKAQWTDGSRICSGGLVFRPRSGATYVYAFVPPGPGDPSCGAVLKEILDPTATPATAVPVRHVNRIDIRRDFWTGMTTGEDLCALATVRADEPPATPAAAAPPPIVVTSSDAAPPPAGASAPLPPPPPRWARRRQPGIRTPRSGTGASRAPRLAYASASPAEATRSPARRPTTAAAAA